MGRSRPLLLVVGTVAAVLLGAVVFAVVLAIALRGCGDAVGNSL